jgi:hypothetical protein
VDVISAVAGLAVVAQFVLQRSLMALQARKIFMLASQWPVGLLAVVKGCLFPVTGVVTILAGCAVPARVDVTAAMAGGTGFIRWAIYQITKMAGFTGGVTVGSGQRKFGFLGVIKDLFCPLFL